MGLHLPTVLADYVHSLCRIPLVLCGMYHFLLTFCDMSMFLLTNSKGNKDVDILSLCNVFCVKVPEKIH